ncbi:hypothetical protein [Luteolibacter soli]|uniref:Uncharacterized protein n=1 Tax=Luteolibacter soli TaxID=3135280 RepID=A0ABU9B1T1_9BACT
MKPKYFPMMLGSLFALTATASLVVPLTAQAQEEQAQANEDVEVLTRGPVHEAFAETVSYEAEAGLTVKSAPPAAIEELPPDQRPDGDNVTWIPGYWAWDDDQNDFLWISGIWRNIPPERQWVPGYWNDLNDGGFQWISGYWADTTTDEVEYVQTAPPKSIDSGPNIAAPDDNQTWVPGNWMWNESRYVWRPGYYLPLRQNWTWVPARYNYSPRGYVFVDGYWDYAVASRGVLFAPVYYRRHVWSDPGYYYTPSIVVSLSLFTDHLFVRPRCGHYYFGDYYAPRYADLGFYSGFDWQRHHRGYDPIWAYNRWDHRNDRGWERRYEDNFNFFRANERFRPPHTWAAMRALGDERLEGGRNRNFARSFDSLVKDPDRVQQFRPVDKDRREKFVAQRQEMREFSRQRRDMEAKPVAAIADKAAREGDGEKRGGAFREKLRRSPVVSRQADQLAAKEAPPKRPEGRGNKALKEAAAVAAAGGNNTPGRGKGRDMVQRQTEGDGVKPDRGPAGQGKGKADGNNEPKVTQNDRERRVPGKDTGGKPERQIQPKPEREKVAPERQVQPKPEREKAAPERQVQPKQQQREKVAPERQVQPKQQPREKAAPERQVQPKPEREKAVPQQREVQPKRQVAPEPRKAQPERQAQPRQPQVKPEKRQGKDKDQASAAPQRRPEQSVQRIAQPKPQPRQEQKAAPKPQVQQRQAQPRQQQPQARPQVQQRQAQPRQQQAQPKPQQRQIQPRQQQAQPKPQQRQAQPRQQQSQPQQRQNKKDRDKKDSA